MAVLISNIGCSSAPAERSDLCLSPQLQMMRVKHL
jgi:hypothetical protein